MQPEDRLADLRWLADTGESAEGAARRLQTTTAALEKWCRSHGQADLWNILTGRNPRDWNRDHNHGRNGIYAQSPRGRGRARWRKENAA
jgi:hypothetical protein